MGAVLCARALRSPLDGSWSAGWPDGRDVELIAVEMASGWLVIHAMASVQRKFAREIEATGRRSR